MRKNLVFLILIISINLNAQISVFDSYENGNVELVSVSQKENSIFVKPALKTDSNTTRCWFNFGLTGYDTSKTTTINISYTSYVVIPQYPVYSYDYKNWHRIKMEYVDAGVKKIRAKFSEDTVYIAAGYPYDYTKMINYVSDISNNYLVDTFTLTTSPEGLRIPYFVISNKSYEATDVVWIIARQHAFETTLNYSLEGFINYLISDKRKPKRLLKNTIIYIVPMVDVDNVFVGASGRMQKPVDYNRDWSNNPYWNTVRIIQEKIIETIEGKNYRIFLDFHSTYPGASNPIFGIFNEYKEDDYGFANVKKFLSIFKHNAGYSLNEIKGDMEKDYADAFNNGIKNPMIKVSDFATTVECDWNINHNGKQLTQYELRNVGALMAETLCDYLNMSDYIELKEETH